MLLFGSLTKEALHTMRRQTPQVVQKQRQPSATVIRNRPIKEEYYQDQFYNELVTILREKGYTTKLDDNKTSHIPKDSNLVISHMNGLVKNKLLGKDVKKLNIPKRKGNLFFNHIMSKNLKSEVEKYIDGN